MRDKAKQLKPLLTDRNALSQCDTEIRECQKYIDYFIEELAKVESRKDVDTNVAGNSNLDPTSVVKDSTNPDLTSVHDVPFRPSSTEHRDIKKYSTLGTYRHPLSTCKKLTQCFIRFTYY